MATDRTNIQAGYIYPLAVPDLFDDDDWGIGFDHVIVPAGIFIPDQCWVADVWIARADGTIHPGYSDSPMPVRVENIVVAKGRPFQGNIPDRKSIWDSPCFKR